MRFELPEISWHSTQPIYSCCFQLQSGGDFNRLATGGADNDVKIWKLWSYDDKVKIEILSILSEHKRSVNCVSFSPSSQYLASCDDDGVIHVWSQCDPTDVFASSFMDDNADLNKEFWKISKTFRGHIEEVMDLSWSADSSLLLSGSLDTCAKLWNVASGTCVYTFKEGKGLVQGVSIDPLGKYLATYADDKSVRIYHGATRRCVFRNSKVSSLSGEKSFRIFGDTGECFFHRIQFSPGGELLLVPSGSYQLSEESSVFCTYVYCRESLNKPSFYLPTGNRPSLAVAFNPHKFKLRNNQDKMTLNLPYRLIFAVLCEDCIIFYDTENCEPFTRFSAVHYATMNSGSWSADGLTFVGVSSDGYVTIASFDISELGEIYSEPVLKASENRPCTPLGELIGSDPNTPQSLVVVKKPPQTPEVIGLQKIDQSSFAAARVRTQEQIETSDAKSSQKKCGPLMSFFKSSPIVVDVDDDDDLVLSDIANKSKTASPCVTPSTAKSGNPKCNSNPSNTDCNDQSPISSNKRRANFVTLTPDVQSTTCGDGSSKAENSSPAANKRKVSFITLA